MPKYKYENNEKMPVYLLDVDTESNEGIKMISIVADPAIQVKGFCFSAEEKPIAFQFKAMKDQQKIVGPAMIPDMDIPRENINGAPGIVRFSKDSIQRIADKFSADQGNRSINLDHSNRMVEGYITEKWIVMDSNYDKTKFYNMSVPIGTYMIEVKIEDEDFWKTEVQDLGKFGFSIEANLLTKPLNLSTDEMIDSLTLEECQRIIKELGLARTPPLHENCTCTIEDGKWKLGVSESGPCNLCIEARDNYNS